MPQIVEKIRYHLTLISTYQTTSFHLFVILNAYLRYDILIRDEKREFLGEMRSDIFWDSSPILQQLLLEIKDTF